MPFPIYDTADAVPEPFREEYEEREGKWHPKVPDVAKLNTALHSERERAKASETARKAAEQKAADLERAAEARAKGISEEELTKIRAAEALARKPIEDERDRLATENRKLKLTDRVQALFLQHEGMSDRVEDAMLTLERRSDLGDAGGIVWKDKEGNVTADTPDAFFRKLKAEKPWLFKGSNGSGSGANGSNGGDSEVPAATAQRIAAEKRAQVGGAF